MQDRGRRCSVCNRVRMVMMRCRPAELTVARAHLAETFLVEASVNGADSPGGSCLQAVTRRANRLRQLAPRAGVHSKILMRTSLKASFPSFFSSTTTSQIIDHRSTQAKTSCSRARSYPLTNLPLVNRNPTKGGPRRAVLLLNLTLPISLDTSFLNLHTCPRTPFFSEFFLLQLTFSCQ
jgi:hypothetical protein